jgi:hypothetical protein
MNTEIKKREKEREEKRIVSLQPIEHKNQKTLWERQVNHVLMVKM